MLYEPGETMETFDRRGRVRIHGEIWNALSNVRIDAGQSVTVMGIDGLPLRVKPK